MPLNYLSAWHLDCRQLASFAQDRCRVLITSVRINRPQEKSSTVSRIKPPKGRKMQIDVKGTEIASMTVTHLETATVAPSYCAG